MNATKNAGLLVVNGLAHPVRIWSAVWVSSLRLLACLLVLWTMAAPVELCATHSLIKRFWRGLSKRAMENAMRYASEMKSWNQRKIEKVRTSPRERTSDPTSL